ncbi:MAG: filamentous hemagglutinin N-terminal domain-containing protein [Alphaproteobacteria bacterium]
MTTLSLKQLTLHSLLTLAICTPTLVHAAKRVTSSTLPTGENVIAGTIESFNRSTPKNLTITQSSDRAIIEWNAFDIGKKATVNFIQPSQNAWTVNRVVSPGTDPTKILGKLNANGQVMVLDPNGVIFGNRSRIDVNGIIVSTGDIADQDFMKGTALIAFTKGTGAKGIRSRIDLAGKITVGNSGIAAFVAPWVRNRGTITANLGKITLAAAENFTVDLYGDKLVELDTGVTTKNANINNRGTLNANGGTIELSIGQAEHIVSSVINMTGVINAANIENKNGKIILSNPNTPDKRQRRNIIRISKNKKTSLNADQIYIDGTTDSRKNRYAQKQDVTNLVEGNPYPEKTTTLVNNTTPEIKNIDPTHRTKQITKHYNQAIKTHDLDITITQYPRIASLNNITPHAAYNE